MDVPIVRGTGKSVSEALILESVNAQYDDGLWVNRVSIVLFIQICFLTNIFLITFLVDE
jgi:hypothetical protein